MNAISAVKRHSEFAVAEHLVLTIDNTPLDVMLDSRFPGQNLIGLVPTLLDWMDDQREWAVVWNRILPSPGQRTIAPVLMCPDDTDFWCTVVLADVETGESTVRWHRLGLDASPAEELPDGIGQEVKWFEDFGPFEFERAAYVNCVDAFRQEARTTDST